MFKKKKNTLKITVFYTHFSFKSLQDVYSVQSIPFGKFRHSHSRLLNLSFFLLFAVGIIKIIILRSPRNGTL